MISPGAESGNRKTVDFGMITSVFAFNIMCLNQGSSRVEGLWHCGLLKSEVAESKWKLVINERTYLLFRKTLWFYCRRDL